MAERVHIWILQSLVVAVLCLGGGEAAHASCKKEKCEWCEDFCEDYLAYEGTRGGGAERRPPRRMVQSLYLLEGDGKEPLDLANLHLGPVPDGEAASLCIHLRTTDSAYVADVETKQLVFDSMLVNRAVPSDYGEQLRRYRAAELLALGMIAEDCSRLGGEALVPVSLSSSPDRMRLLLRLPRGTPRAELVGPAGEAGIRLKCKARRSSVASHTCELPLEGVAAGTHELKVKIALIGAEPEHHSWRLRLP